ncbi:Spy/CpxP family protein refolding chaperone [Parasedimentitalea huanghaiensis]|uniref:Spy/CpxP family protein refolding chaperone n=1 Tax=Parasedimentitalea huanghaiensis TaxID=2682100 RepID=UPI00142F596D|nr:Spy/CpxP family protein refolding chaperone [Zongyanglinia huanghaiensis]
MKSPLLIALLMIAVGAPALAETIHQPYKGFEIRSIASLSVKDIEELQSGAGWGLALPAELNGYPGPAHVLELQTDLDLTPSQASQMQAIFDAMQIEAVTQGNALIQAEHDLDQGFKSGDLSPAKLRTLIAAAEAARANLRYIHLSRHLMSVDVLSAEQSSKYSELRGYISDPCQPVPYGHDVDMWRKHNGCGDN